MRCSESNNLSITEDIFRKTKRLCEGNAEDNEEEDRIEIKFDLEGSEIHKTSVPVKSVALELDGSTGTITSIPQHLHQIHIHKIGGRAQQKEHTLVIPLNLDHL
jgi:hypothetical protein